MHEQEVGLSNDTSSVFRKKYFKNIYFTKILKRGVNILYHDFNHHIIESH